MSQLNYHTNIMLDLECTNAYVPNPAVIQLAAIHFNIDTGDDLGHLITSINLDSCYSPETNNDVDLASKESSESVEVPDKQTPKFAIAEADEGTLAWLAENIPETLFASRTSDVTLAGALFKLNQFIRRSCKQTEEKLKGTSHEWRLNANRDTQRSQPMIWGNGAVADNVWIASSYRACDMTKPWKYYNDMCVRTFVEQAHLLTGTDFRRQEKFIGKRHDALDDCRHQIKYLVKARNSLTSALTTTTLSLPLANPNPPQVRHRATRERRKGFGKGLSMNDRSPPTSSNFIDASFMEEHAARVARIENAQAALQNANVSLGAFVTIKDANRANLLMIPPTSSTTLAPPAAILQPAPDSSPESSPFFSTMLSPNSVSNSPSTSQQVRTAIAKAQSAIQNKNPQGLLSPEVSFSADAERKEDGTISESQKICLPPSLPDGSFQNPISLDDDGTRIVEVEHRAKRVKGESKPNGLLTPQTSFYVVEE